MFIWLHFLLSSDNTGICRLTPVNIGRSHNFLQLQTRAPLPIYTIIPEYPNLQPMRQAQQPKLRQDLKRGTWPCPYMCQEPTRCKPS